MGYPTRIYYTETDKALMCATWVPVFAYLLIQRRPVLTLTR